MGIRRRTFLGAVGTLGLIGCTDEDPDSEEIPEEFPEPETPRYGYGGTPVESTPTPTPTDRISTPRIDQRIPGETGSDDGSGEDNTTTQAQDPAEPASTPSTPETGGGGTNPNAGSPDSDTDGVTEPTPDDTGTETNPDDTDDNGSGDQPPTGDSGDDSDDEETDGDVLEEYTVTVFVTDENGTAIEADVTLDGLTRVTEDGIATFDDVTEGEYHVEASTEGYEASSEHVTVASDTEITVTLRAHYTVTVHTRDTAGNPIVADVSLAGDTRTAENGVAMFEAVLAGEYTVRAATDRYQSESESLLVDSDTETTLSLAETEDQTEWCAAENEEYATQGYGEYGYGGVVPCA